jgi:beta-mannanase
MNNGLHKLASVIVAAVALSGIFSSCGETQAAVASHAVSNSQKFAAAFVNWGADGRELNLRKWEAWLDQPTSSVLAIDFYSDSTWQSFFEFSWLPGFWKKLNPARNVVWSIPLTVKGTPLADVSSGLHDAEFEAAAKAISAAQPKAVIRIGWEMNSVSMVWFAKGQEADYIAAFRRVVGIFRRYSPDFKYDWCPGWGAQDTPADAAYPGDDVVDYIGLDVYDFKFDGTAEERWNTHYLNAAFGLQWQRDFAIRHGKRMSYPEWGVGNFGDNPFFVQQMHDWFVKNADNIAYAAYFDVDGLWPTQIDNGQFPKSQLLFRKLFRRSAFLN